RLTNIFIPVLRAANVRPFFNSQRVFWKKFHFFLPSFCTCLIMKPKASKSFFRFSNLPRAKPAIFTINPFLTLVKLELNFVYTSGNLFPPCIKKHVDRVKRNVPTGQIFILLNRILMEYGY
ncbi:hypothetical protein, partial [Zobellia uliginosa]|uniref:hypothetical protein n=1 Tax=Zobellia uliginosa TaxID=143224 RepID=UPI0026E2AA12